MLEPLLPNLIILYSSEMNTNDQLGQLRPIGFTHKFTSGCADHVIICIINDLLKYRLFMDTHNGLAVLENYLFPILFLSV